MLSRSRISELSKPELSLQNVKWLFKLLLSHQFALQEIGLRLCLELPPSTQLGLRRRWWLLSAPTIWGLGVHFFPWVPCEGLFLAVWMIRDVFAPLYLHRGGISLLAQAVVPGEVQVCSWDICR